jgi:hypothetical protein
VLKRDVLPTFDVNVRADNGLPSERAAADPPRSPALDLIISFCGIWLAGGFLFDSWAHLHVGVETFFTPYHAIFYAAMLGAAITFGIFAVRNQLAGYAYPRFLPVAYRQALIGVPVFFLGGVGDLIWHTVFGVENRIEAVTSPTHLIIGYGVVLVLSGPIRSAFAARTTVLSLRAQLPLIFCVASILEFAHLGMSYAFDPSVARMDAAPTQVAGSPYALLYAALAQYKLGTGVTIILLTAIVEMAFALWIASRFRLAPGAMTVFFILGDTMIATALTNDRPILAIHFTQALVAGIVADIILARARGSRIELPSLRTMRTFAILVPLAYYSTFFALTIAIEGTWWSWSLIASTIVWTVAAGFGLTLLMREPTPLESIVPGFAPALHSRVQTATRRPILAAALIVVEPALYLAVIGMVLLAVHYICTI